MPLVRGHDAYTAVEIAENTPASAWGSTPTGTGTGWKAVPIISETMTLEREFYPKSKEFGEAGGVPFIEYGRGTVKGQLVIQPRYNQEWFWNLIAQFFGAEAITPDVTLVNATAATNCNRHTFSFSAALSKGFAIRVWKGGATQAGSIETFLGCMISRLVWEQPEDDVPRITLDIIGKSAAISNLTGTPTVVGVLNETGGAITPLFVKPRDLSNSPPAVGAPFVQGTTHSFFGIKEDATSALNQFNIRGFTLTVDRHLTVENAFANDPDTIEQPGVNETRDVTMEIRSLVEQDYANANKPYSQYLNKTPSAIRVIYATAGPAIASNQRHAIMLDLPNVVWEEAKASISEPGAPPTNFKARAILGTFINASTPPTGSAGDLRFVTTVNQSDDNDLVWSIV